MAVLTFALVWMMLPGGASAAGCEVLRAPAEQADCIAREAARERARAEVARVTEPAGPADEDGHSAAWGDALEEARGFHPGEIVEPRPLAAVLGLAWFGLAVRSRLRSRRGSAR